MKNKTTKLAAAIIIIAVLIGLNHFGGTIDGTSVVWADVAQKIQNVSSFVCQRKDTQITTNNDKAVETISMIYSSSEYGSRLDSFKNGNIHSSTYTLPSEKAIISVFSAIKKHFRKPLSEEMLAQMDSQGPREMVSRFFSLEYKELGRKTINDTVVEGIEVNDPAVVAANFPVEKISARLWVDIETNLPVLLESEFAAQDGTVELKTTIDQFQWNIEFAAGFFKPNIENSETLDQKTGGHKQPAVAKLLDGPCVYEFADGSQVKLYEGAKVKLPANNDKRGFKLIAGQIEVTVAKGKSGFIVATPFGYVKALGTIFQMDVIDNISIGILAVNVKEGSVQVTNSKGTVVIRENQSATAVKGQKPYDFRQDNKLPPRLIERIDSMLTAIETGDKKLYVSNYNIQAMFDLIKGKIRYEDHTDWFAGMSPEDAERMKKGLAFIENLEQLESAFMQSISDKRHKLYVGSVELASDGKHATAICIERRDNKTLRITPQWTHFKGDWWQTDD